MAKKTKSANPRNEYGTLVLRNISDRLGEAKPNYQRVRRMLLAGEIPVDILEEWVYEDPAVLAYFKVDYDTVLAASMSAVHGLGTPPRGAARRRPKQSRNPLPRVTPRPTTAGSSGPPSTPSSASTPPPTRTTASDIPDRTSSRDTQKDQSPSLAGKVGRGIIGAVAAGAVKTLFNTQRAGVGSILLSSIQEKLDRGNMGPVGTTRSGQPTGITEKHILAPLKSVIEDMNKSQTLILDALKTQSTRRESLLDRARRLEAEDVEARRVTTEPPQPVTPPSVEPITREAPPIAEEPPMESTEAQVESMQSQKLILEKLISIDDNVSSILKILTNNRSPEGAGGEKSGGILSSLIKYGSGLIEVFGTMFKSIGGLIGAFPKLSGVLAALGTAASGLIGMFSSVGKIALEAGVSVASKVKGLFNKTPTVSPDDINVRTPTPDAPTPDGGKKGMFGKAKNLLKNIGPKVLKKLPLVSVPFVLSAVADRMGSGDYLGAGGEALSGLLAQIPGVGTALSAATDIGLFARDTMKENVAVNKPESVMTPAPSVSKEAYTGVESLTRNTEDMKEAQRIASMNIVAPTTIQNNSTQAQTIIPPNNGGTVDRSRFIDRLYAFA